MQYIKRYFLCLGCSVVLNCAGVFAQYNSDFREVKGKKIKSAIAYSVQHDGDTNFFRYNYDRNGFVTSFDIYTWNEGIFTQYYDERGVQTELLNLEPTGVTNTVLTRPEYVKLHGATFTYDTAYFWKCHHDANGGIDYMIKIEKIGKQRKADLWRRSGDTAYTYHAMGNSAFVLDKIEILARVDSVKDGYAKLSYTFEESDTVIQNCVVIVYDHKRNVVRKYYLGNSDTLIANQYGVLYDPLKDPEATLKLSAVYQPENSLHIFPELTPEEDLPIDETAQLIGHRYKCRSLEVIMKLGTVYYEYYE